MWRIETEDKYFETKHEEAQDQVPKQQSKHSKMRTSGEWEEDEL